MAKTAKIKTPIMSQDEERFMAFEGLLQWTQSVITQGQKVSAARDTELSVLSSNNQEAHLAILDFHTQCHFFAIAAYKLFEYRDWVLTFGLCSTAAFSEIDEFSKQVVTASTGLQALAILRDNSRISILLTDIQMPGMGGEELAGIAATSRPDLRVIFASGSIRPSADAAFLQKPTKPLTWLDCYRRCRPNQQPLWGI
jgi:CheY-like chemotaxis protein